MGNNIIKSFTINGLFGTTNLTIPFDDKVKILIGENGLGKTQVLNILYYILIQDFDQLKKIKFKSIEITLVDEVIFIDTEVLSLYSIPDDELKVIWTLEDEETMSNYLEYLSDAYGSNLTKYNTREIFLKRHSDNLKDIQKIKKNLINKIPNIKILYFPTYRRIEEELNNLGYNTVPNVFWDDININDKFVDNDLIHFGMNDVQEKFNELTHKIEKLSKDGLSKISSEILSQLIKGIPTVDRQFLEKIKPNDIEILLARVGNGISESDKDGIRQLVSNGNKDIKDIYSLFFLQKLIKIYDQQRELDNRIKNFRDVCNKYLVNKKVIYDESQIEIYIKVNGINQSLNLSKLSSGEKQIISIFSKIYLSESDEHYIVLFDEPELSLSIFWQRNLLPDIVDSGKCEFLFAVTHSPFIFENKLDKYTTSLGEYFTPLAPELVG